MIKIEKGYEYEKYLKIIQNTNKTGKKFFIFLKTKIATKIIEHRYCINSVQNLEYWDYKIDTLEFSERLDIQSKEFQNFLKILRNFNFFKKLILPTNIFVQKYDFLVDEKTSLLLFDVTKSNQNLKFLKLSNEPLAVGFLKQMKKNPNMTSIDTLFFSGPFDLIDYSLFFEMLNKNKNITTLTIVLRKEDQLIKTTEYLKYNKTIENLYLFDEDDEKNEEFFKKFLGNLQQNSTIKSLDFLISLKEETKKQSIYENFLQKNQTIEKFFFNNCQIDDFLPGLKKNKSLKKLEFVGLFYDSDEMSIEFFDYLKDNKNIEFLSFEDIDVADYGLVAEYLEKNENLKEFSFCFNTESDWNEIIIQNVMEINTIERLTLTFFDSMPHFLNALIEKMKNLKYLDLDFKQLDVNNFLFDLERNVDSKIIEIKLHLRFENDQFTRMNKILKRNKENLEKNDHFPHIKKIKFFDLNFQF